jgi:hypothetical protein
LSYSILIPDLVGVALEALENLKLISVRGVSVRQIKTFVWKDNSQQQRKDIEMN